VVVLGSNSELSENGKDTVVLDWFRPPESKTLRPVWWDYAWKESPLERSSRSPYMVSGLGFPFKVGGPSLGSVTDLGRSPSVIIERIPRSMDLLAAPPPRSREKLAPQAWQVFCNLDQVIRGLPRSPGLWIRSLGPLAGRWGFWQVEPT
jgi:hypothetical protein